jgi:hypothetical protein
MKFCFSCNMYRYQRKEQATTQGCIFGTKFGGTIIMTKEKNRGKKKKYTPRGKFQMRVRLPFVSKKRFIEKIPTASGSLLPLIIVWPISIALGSENS